MGTPSVSLNEVLDRLQGLPQEQLESIAAEVAQATRHLPWIPNPGPQTEAAECEADELFYGGEAGGGKALSVDELVVTPFGFRRMGDLSVGDTICSADGSPTRIIGVFPQGTRPLYRVTFQDGVSVLADADHRWNYSVASKAWTKSNRQWKVGTTSQLAAIIASGSRPLIPLCGKLKFTKAYKTPQRTIPPYVLGLLLGDGYTKQSGPGAKWSFSTIDKELLLALPGDWVKDSSVSYRLRGPMRLVLQSEFKRMGLAGCGSLDKFIPEPYKWAPVEDRIALLQGLMDTDGTNDSRGHASYTSISRALADDVAWLVRSLGGRAKVTSKPTTHNMAYTVTIRTSDSTELFRLERKRARGSEYQHGDPKRRIESIVYERDGDAVCIAVDSPDSLYLVGEGCVVTHNTDLGLGLAITAHRRSLCLRRTNKESHGLVERMTEILGTRDGWSSQEGIWRYNSRAIDIGGCQLEVDKQKYKGKPHDLIFFDEIPDFLESQYTFIIGWNRSADANQRCRVVAAGNPPTTPEGLWVIKRWAAWLDPNHPNPAKPGELRWYTTIGGKDTEVDGPGPHYIEGEDKPVRARSRTFIRAGLADNEELASTGYDATLAGLPDELRHAYRGGRFDRAVADKPYQVIPSAWIAAAQERWTPDGHEGYMMTALAFDPAGGGDDAAELAVRYGAWIGPIVTTEGKETADGSRMAATIVTYRRHDCSVVVDYGGGYGGAVCLRLEDNGIEPYKFNGAEKTTEKAKGGKLMFANKRALTYWRLREELNPDQDGGAVLQLPPDPELRADLAAPTWRMSARGILIQSKDELRELLGRSPGKGDVVAMVLDAGNKAATRAISGRTSGGQRGRNLPQVLSSRRAARHLTGR